MEINIHREFSAINDQDWNSLLSASEIDVPFLRYGYLKSWWDHKGGGEWPDDSELLLITGFEESKLAAIAPLFSTKDDRGEKILFLGSVEISDYLDFICPAEQKEFFIPKVLEIIHRTKEQAHRIELVNIPERSSSISQLKHAAGMTGWTASIENAYHTPAIRLADDWDTYLAGIDKKQRHEIRRKMRRAEENADSIKWTMADDPETLDAQIDGFFTLMEMDEEKKKFLTPRMRDQMKSIMRWAFDEDILQLSFLEIDKKKAAAYLCFDYQSHLLVYNSGFDYSLSEYSPGWVLLSYLIQDAIGAGKTHFDFMRGDETYKYRFGAEDGFVVRAALDRS